MSRPSDSYASGAQAALRTVKLAGLSFTSPDPRDWGSLRGAGEIFSTGPVSPAVQDFGYGLLGLAGLYGLNEYRKSRNELAVGADFNAPIPPELSAEEYLGQRF